MVRLKSIVIITGVASLLTPLSSAQTAQYPLAKTYATVDEAIAAASASARSYQYSAQPVPIANVGVINAAHSQAHTQPANTYTYGSPTTTYTYESPTTTYTSNYAPNEAPANTQYSYTVLSGDTLYRIAKLHNTKVSDIMNANALTTSAINPGQALLIPAPSNAQAFTISSNVKPFESKPVIFASQIKRIEEPVPLMGQNYRVLPGDSLSSIARLNCTTVDSITNASGITRESILTPGQYLTVSSDICAQ